MVTLDLTPEQKQSLVAQLVAENAQQSAAETAAIAQPVSVADVPNVAAGATIDTNGNPVAAAAGIDAAVVAGAATSTTVTDNGVQTDNAVVAGAVPLTSAMIDPSIMNGASGGSNKPFTALATPPQGTHVVTAGAGVGHNL